MTKLREQMIQDITLRGPSESPPETGLRSPRDWHNTQVGSLRADGKLASRLVSANRQAKTNNDPTH